MAGDQGDSGLEKKITERKKKLEGREKDRDAERDRGG